MTAPVRRLFLVVAAFAAVAGTARAAGEGIDSIMLRDPPVAWPKVVPVFDDKLLPLWLELLARPEADHKARAAGTIADARRRGMPGLDVAIPKLVAELERKDAPSAVRVALVHALAVLDAKDAAAPMFRAARDGDIDVRQIVDPCLTRWQYEPVRATWLERIQAKPSQRGTILAIRGLLAAKELRAIPRLREIALAADEPSPVRLEAAAAVAEMRPEGLEPDAKRLAAEAGMRGIDARVVAATLLRRHDGAAAISLLQAFVQDPEPAVAARAMARLVELDPRHVAPVLDAALANADAAVRLPAVLALRRDPVDANIRKLGDRLADVHPAVRTKARLALLELFEKPEHKDAVRREGMRLLNGGFWGGLQQASLLLGKIDHKPAAKRLIELQYHERNQVFVSAAWALRVLDLPDTAAPALDIFVDRLRYLKANINTIPGLIGQGYDEQLSQLAQLIGQRKYAPASTPFRALIPPAGGPIETRAAGIWALGQIHDGQRDLGFERLLEGRLNAIQPMDVELPIVRRMCAMSLGRVHATATVASLRRHYSGRPVRDDVSNACGWALERITGEKMPPPGIDEEKQVGFFALPLGK
jgi:HEAT repeat protein